MLLGYLSTEHKLTLERKTEPHKAQGKNCKTRKSWKLYQLLPTYANTTNTTTRAAETRFFTVNSWKPKVPTRTGLSGNFWKLPDPFQWQNLPTTNHKRTNLKPRTPPPQHQWQNLPPRTTNTTNRNNSHHSTNSTRTTNKTPQHLTNLLPLDYTNTTQPLTHSLHFFTTSPTANYLPTTYQKPLHSTTNGRTKEENRRTTTLPRLLPKSDSVVKSAF